MTEQYPPAKYYFDPSELKSLPHQYEAYGSLLQSAHDDLEYLATGTLEMLGYKLKGTFLHFKDKELQPLILQNNKSIEFEITQYSPKGDAIWRYHFLNISLRTIEEVEEGLVESLDNLFENNILEFITYLSSASSNIGRLALTHAMCSQGYIDGMGSQYNLVLSGELGGKKSGEARRANARLAMTPEELRTEKNAWVARGQPEREAARFLAVKYHCSTDYVRKYLNRP